jgi:molybdopterin-guanine dinucleotide biosynthesis protein
VFTRDQSIDRVVGELSKTVDVILVEGFKDLRLGYKVELGGGENLEEVSEKVLEELLECLRKTGRA